LSVPRGLKSRRQVKIKRLRALLKPCPDTKQSESEYCR
jgi:hypothetical protein